MDFTCGQIVRKIAVAASVTALTVCSGGSHAVVASCKHGLPGALSSLDLQTFSLEPIEGAPCHLLERGLLVASGDDKLKPE